MTTAGSSRFVVLAALSLLYILLMAATFNSLGQVLPFMVADLRMSWGEAGFGFTLLGIACGAASLVPAVLIRRLGVSLTLLGGTALLIMGFGLLAVAQGSGAYHGGATLLGLGFCLCGTVPAVHVIGGSFERRSTALGVYFTSGSLGAVAGPILFYATDTTLGGWRIYWWLCAAAALLAGGFAAFATRRPGEAMAEATASEPDGDPDWEVRAALGTWQGWTVVAAYTGCLLVNTTVHSFAFQHLMEHGQTKASATALISLAALAGAGAAAAAGVIGEKVDARLLTMLSLAMLALTSASLSIGEGRLVLALFAGSMGIGLGFSYVSTAMLMQDYFGRRPSLELYSIMTVVSTSAAIGPGLGGIVRDRTGNFSAVFAALAVIDVALLLVVSFMRRPAAAMGEAVRPQGTQSLEPYPGPR